jgi:hypothetical protein
VNPQENAEDDETSTGGYCRGGREGKGLPGAQRPPERESRRQSRDHCCTENCGIAAIGSATTRFC